MNKNFIGILAAALVVIGSLLWYSVHANEAHLLTLKGSVLKVRTIPLEASATLAIIDFRVTNPSSANFSVQDVELEMQPKGADAKSKPLAGGLLQKREIADVFQYEPKAGAKEHDPVGAGDSINAGQTKEFMVAARIDLPQSDVDARSGFKIRLHDFNGPVFDIVESQPAH